MLTNILKPLEHCLNKILSISTASFALGSVVVVASEVVEVIVGETSSHSYESQGHPPGQFS